MNNLWPFVNGLLYLRRLRHLVLPAIASAAVLYGIALFSRPCAFIVGGLAALGCSLTVAYFRGNE